MILRLILELRYLTTGLSVQISLLLGYLPNSLSGSGVFWLVIRLNSTLMTAAVSEDVPHGSKIGPLLFRVMVNDPSHFGGYLPKTRKWE